MPSEIDPTFLALPYERLAQAALARARDFGVSHADFRFERNRYQFFSVRDGVLEGAQDSEDLGFAVRVILDGAWGFASGVALTESEAVTVAETAVTVAQVAARMTRRPVELAPEPVHKDVTWVSSYDVNPLDVPLADKTGLFAGVDARADGSRRRRPRHRWAGAGAGEQVLRRPGWLLDHPATGPPRAGARGARVGPVVRGVRLDALDRAAGRARLGALHRGHLRLRRRACGPAGAAAREARRAERARRHLRPGDPSLQPVADHPRVDRPRDRARPRAGLRGQLRRHVVRDLRQPRHPRLRLPRAARDRRPHHRARPVHGRVRRRGRADPVVGHRPWRDPGGLPARPRDGAHLRRRAERGTFQRLLRTPTPPATSRSSGWPTSRCSRTPTAPTPTA